VTREKQLALTNWLKGNLTDRLRTRNSPLDSWIGLSSVLRPLQHSIGYMGDGFYRSKDPTNSIKVLKEMLQRTKQTTKTTKYTYGQTVIDTERIYTK